MKITNITKAPQGVNTTLGVVYLKPGESREDLEFAEHELPGVQSSPHLSIDGKAPERITPAPSPAPASDATKPADTQNKPAPKAKAKAPRKPADPELVSARADYKAKFGNGAGPRWPVAQLRERL